MSGDETTPVEIDVEPLRKQIVRAVMPFCKGLHPALVVDALLAAAATMTQLASDYDVEDFARRGREVFLAYLMGKADLQ